MIKKVEILRAVERTVSQVDELITNLSDLGDFSQTDKELMESFKKIPHIGTKQLETFINDLESKGAELDEYSIIYYTTQLRLGPLRKFTDQFTNFIAGSDRIYWKRSPDILGTNSNVTQDDASTGLHDSTKTIQYTPLLTRTKTPKFIADENDRLSNAIRSVSNSCFKESTEADNTLPIVDKKTGDRIRLETSNGVNSTPHGNYIVKDVEFLKATQSASSSVQSSVEGFLGTEDYRLYKFKRDYNPFDPNANETRAANSKIMRKLVTQLIEYNADGVEIKSYPETQIETDLIGNQFDSIERRQFTLEPLQSLTEKSYDMYTVQGQLGSGEAPKAEPIA